MVRTENLSFFPTNGEGISLLEVFFQFGIILETGRSQTDLPVLRQEDLLDVSLSEVLAHETLVVLGPHVGKELVRAKERLVAELYDQLVYRPGSGL